MTPSNKPKWQFSFEDNVRSLAGTLPDPNPNAVPAFVSYLNKMLKKENYLVLSRRHARPLPVGYEHVYVKSPDGSMVAAISTRRRGGVTAGVLISAVTCYGENTFDRIEQAPDVNPSSKVLHLIAHDAPKVHGHSPSFSGDTSPAWRR